MLEAINLGRGSPAPRENPDAELAALLMERRAEREAGKFSPAKEVYDRLQKKYFADSE